MASVRNSNIELLRILCMIFIVIGHFVHQSGFINSVNDLNLYMTLFVGSGARIAVTVFLMIGCWYLVDAKFKASRIINLYSELWIYTVSILIILKCFHFHLDFVNVIRAIFPFFGCDLWFVSIYLFLILLTPFLYCVFNLPRKILKQLLVLLFILIPFFSTIWVNMDTKFCNILFFVFIYLFIGYVKKYLFNKINIKPILLLVLSFLIYTTLISIQFYSLQVADSHCYIYKIVNCYLGDFKTIPNLLCSFPIFYAFINFKPKTNNIINYLAQSSLAVYIIHQTHNILPYIWGVFFRYTDNSNFLYPLCVGIIFYMLCVPVDLIRRKCITPFLTNNIISKKIEKQINQWYADINLYGEKVCQK